MSLDQIIIPPTIVPDAFAKIEEMRTSFNTLAATSNLNLEADHLRVEYQLRKEKLIAEEKIRSYATFLANQAHDLRTPLGAVMGYAEMFLEGMHIDGDIDHTKTYAEAITVAAQHLMLLVNDLLDICQIDAKKLELREQKVCVNTLINDAALMIFERAKQANIELVVTVDVDLPKISVDHQRLTQAILNLLSNAVKFSPDGGRVDLFAYKDTDEDLKILISDNGVGMKAEDIPIALQEFGQVGQGKHQKTPSTGLGLPLAKRLIELHEGSVTIQSQLGQGTTITLALPSHRWCS